MGRTYAGAWMNPRQTLEITDRTFISVTVDIFKPRSLAEAAVLLADAHPELAWDLGFMADAWMTNARIAGYKV